VYAPALLGLLLTLAAGCNSDKLTDAASNTDAADFKSNRGRPKPVVRLVVAPDTSVLAPQQVQQFTATGTRSDGSTVPVRVIWRASGGTIDSTGNFTAGAVLGTYQVIGTDSAQTVADTARVVVSDSVVSPPDTSIAPPDSSVAPPDTGVAVVGSPCGTATPTVAIRVGDSWQSKVNASPAGTIFCIAAGTHHRQTVVPKSGNQFWGAGALQSIMDGDSATTYAFRAPTTPYPSNVEIHNLVIRRYMPALQAAAVMAGAGSKSNATRGWVIADNEITANAGGGIRIGTKTRVLRNKVHHNWQIGISGVGDSTLVEGNEIAYNNYLKGVSYGWEAGGTKFVKTRGLVVRNNYVHHNWGPGLWNDIDNINTLVEGNRVVGNADQGIFHEISYDAVIRNNVVQGNGFDRSSWLWGAGIMVAASPNVEVYGNSVSGNFNGIAAVQQNRGSGAYGTHLVQNLNVHDNTVDVSKGGRSGIAQDIGDTSVFTSWNNRFVHNTYSLGANAKPFEWMNGQRTELQWKSYGQDQTGTFNR
jgi:parallel beta-helix repeat protein